MIALLLCTLASAGDFATEVASHLTWKGYVEHQAGFLVLPGRPSSEDWSDTLFLDTTKARLDLRAKPTPGFTANVHAIARLYHGSRTFQLDQMLPDKFGDDLALIAALAPEYVTWTFEDSFTLNDAYVTAQEGRFRLRIGKQPMRFGSGYVWNPTDPFTVIDMLDPTYERVGVNAVRAQVHLPSEGLIEAYALPGERLADVRLKHTGMAFRGRVGVGAWVFAVTYAGFHDTAGVDAMLTPIAARRHMAGAEVTGDIAGVGVWAEAAYNTYGKPDDGWRGVERFGDIEWVEVLGGATYTFRGGFTVMAEGLYNGRGIADPKDYTLSHWFAYLDQTIRYLGKGYGTVTLQMPVDTIHTTFSLTGISNVTDQSVLVNPWIRYDWNQFLAVSAYGAFGFAPSDTREVAEMTATGQAAYLRARLSF